MWIFLILLDLREVIQGILYGIYLGDYDGLYVQSFSEMDIFVGI